jgi:hypothetical protein
MVKREKDPLAPLETGVQVLLGMLVLLGVLLLGSTIFGGNPSFASVGATEVCVGTSPGEGVGYGGTGRGGDHPIGLYDDVRWFPREIEICDTQPTAGTIALGITRALIEPIGAIGALLLLWWVVRRARREGVFGDRIPAGLYVLGCYLLAWALTGWLSGGTVDALLLRRMADTTDGFVFSWPEFPLVSLLLGLAMLTLARVMSQAVALREDSDATI